MSSRVSNKVFNIAEPPRNSKPFLNSKNLACATCKKCIYRANHDACILKYLSERFSPNKTSIVYMKTMHHRSGLTWKPMGRIFTFVSIGWIPTRKTIGTCLNTNDFVIPLGKETCTPNTIICASSYSLSAGMDKSQITRKQSKIEQARTRESEEFKKKPKDQSRSQKSQASVKISQEKSKSVKDGQ
ncbi:hypothetical protein Tco_0188841 [Tanacetum coccineum]